MTKKASKSLWMEMKRAHTFSAKWRPDQGLKSYEFNNFIELVCRPQNESRMQIFMPYTLFHTMPLFVQQS
jgi:hypothetical protein